MRELRGVRGPIQPPTAPFSRSGDNRPHFLSRGRLLRAARFLLKVGP